MFVQRDIMLGCEGFNQPSLRPESKVHFARLSGAGLLLPPQDGLAGHHVQYQANSSVGSLSAHCLQFQGVGMAQMTHWVMLVSFTYFDTTRCAGCS